MALEWHQVGHRFRGRSHIIRIAKSSKWLVVGDLAGGASFARGE